MSEEGVDPADAFHGVAFVRHDVDYDMELGLEDENRFGGTTGPFAAYSWQAARDPALVDGKYAAADT